MKFSGKMWLIIILNVTKKQGFTVSIKRIFLEKQQGVSNWRYPAFLGLNWSFQILLKFLSFLFLLKVGLFLPQKALLNNKVIDLFCLVFLTLEFLFAVFFSQLTQEVSIVTFNQAKHFNNKFHSFWFYYIIWIKL